MLKRNPDIGQIVIGLEDDFWDDGDPVVLKGKKYVIVGYAEKTRNPYYLIDGERIYIDEEAWHLYDLVEDNASQFYEKLVDIEDL